eukprot:TRINITY_DN28354_c0_g1_i10.p3 TRINITY_DN28354_c0_g1~~TRINITY_DN28354_c0_g1_i10.p3  ORF type:complete len:137 (-),score=5.78 TRINITY_DN28354_c0_g1_i10:330-740(-)
MWFYGFLERYKLSSRVASTHIPQILPSDIEDELIKFWAYCYCFIDFNKIPLERVGNCDETPIYFGYESRKTITAKGAKYVSFKKVEGAKKTTHSSFGNPGKRCQTSSPLHLQRKKENFEHHRAWKIFCPSSRECLG